MNLRYSSTVRSIWNNFDALMTYEKPQDTFVGVCSQGKSCSLGLLQAICFGVPSSCLQCISTGLVVLVWRLRKGAIHS
jgi:hypothetical protein